MVESDTGLVSPSSSRGGTLQLPDFEESDFYVEQAQVSDTLIEHVMSYPCVYYYYYHCTVFTCINRAKTVTTSVVPTVVVLIVVVSW